MEEKCLRVPNGVITFVPMVSFECGPPALEDEGGCRDCKNGDAAQGQAIEGVTDGYRYIFCKLGMDPLRIGRCSFFDELPEGNKNARFHVIR